MGVRRATILERGGPGEAIGHRVLGDPCGQPGSAACSRISNVRALPADQRRAPRNKVWIIPAEFPAGAGRSGRHEASTRASYYILAAADTWPTHPSSQCPTRLFSRHTPDYTSIFVRRVRDASDPAKIRHYGTDAFSCPELEGLLSRSRSGNWQAQRGAGIEGRSFRSWVEEGRPHSFSSSSEF